MAHDVHDDNATSFTSTCTSQPKPVLSSILAILKLMFSWTSHRPILSWWFITEAVLSACQSQNADNRRFHHNYEHQPTQTSSIIIEYYFGSYVVLVKSSIRIAVEVHHKKWFLAHVGGRMQIIDNSSATWQTIEPKLVPSLLSTIFGVISGLSSHQLMLSWGFITKSGFWRMLEPDCR